MKNNLEITKEKQVKEFIDHQGKASGRNQAVRTANLLT